MWGHYLHLGHWSFIEVKHHLSSKAVGLHFCSLTIFSGLSPCALCSSFRQPGKAPWGFRLIEPIFHYAENKDCTSPSRRVFLRFHLQLINQMKPFECWEACFHLTSYHLSFIMDRTQDNKAFGLFSFFWFYFRYRSTQLMSSNFRFLGVSYLSPENKERSVW